MDTGGDARCGLIAEATCPSGVTLSPECKLPGAPISVRCDPIWPGGTVLTATTHAVAQPTPRRGSARACVVSRLTVGTSVLYGALTGGQARWREYQRLISGPAAPRRSEESGSPERSSKRSS